MVDVHVILQETTIAEIATRLFRGYSCTTQCQHLIWWCLNKDPSYRAMLESMDWFTKELQQEQQQHCGWRTSVKDYTNPHAESVSQKLHS